MGEGARYARVEVASNNSSDGTGPTGASLVPGEVVRLNRNFTLPRRVGGSGRRPGEGPMRSPLRASGSTLPEGE